MYYLKLYVLLMVHRLKTVPLQVAQITRESFRVGADGGVDKRTWLETKSPSGHAGSNPALRANF